MKRIFNDYLNDKIKYTKKQKATIALLVIAISGLFGFVYEFIFYYFNGGMKDLYWRGGNFLPWINIYAIGAIIILITTYKFKKKPLLVFLISVVTTGILEYFSGWILLEILGKRFWDYNTEILNFGNINGFICLRSVLFFGVSGLILMYMIIPFIIRLTIKYNIKKLFIISVIIVSIIVFDEFYNLVISRVFGLKDAIDIYESIGLHIVGKGY